MRAPPPLNAHDGSVYPSYDNANTSALQATAARGMYGRVIVNNAQPVINDMIDLSKGLTVINDTTDLSEGFNDMTDLSEGLPVINNTSAKLTCVVVF